MSTPSLQDASAPEPVWTSPRGGFLFFLGFAAIGVAMANLVPAVLTLSFKARLIDPERATTILSIAVGVSALVSIIAFPVLGRLSDRTTSRLGRRTPYLLAAAALVAVGAVAMQAASSTLGLTVAGVITAVGFSSGTVACISVIPDQFPPDRRGPASAVVGLSIPLGAVIGLFIAQLVSPNLAAMILLPAAVAVVGCLAFAVALADPRLSAAERPAFGWRDLLGTFWVNPMRAPDYGWAWLSRLLIFLGVAAVQAYQPFYLTDVLGFERTEVAGAVFLSTLVLTAAALAFAPLASKLSDRIGRRKPFVIAAAAVFSTGLALTVLADSYGAFLVAIGVVGIGQGVYFAVDLALVTEVLPDPANPAKDLGLMNIANTLPGSLVPAIAPAILTIGASAAAPQNYAALFTFGAIAGLVGAALIVPIRKVR